MLNLGLGGSVGNDEGNSILVFDLLHGLFGVYGSLDDVVFINADLDGVETNRGSGDSGNSGLSLGVGSVESGLSVDSVLLGGVGTLLGGLGNLLGDLDCLVLDILSFISDGFDDLGHFLFFNNALFLRL